MSIELDWNQLESNSFITKSTAEGIEIELKTNYTTYLKYYNLIENKTLVEEQKPTKILFKQPNEHSISNLHGTMQNQLEMQVIHSKVKTTEPTPDFPAAHKEVEQLRLVTLFSVSNSSKNDELRDGDPFMQIMGYNVKQMDKTGRFDNTKWFDLDLGTSPDQIVNKSFGDISRDFSQQNKLAYNKFTHKYLLNLFSNDGNSFMYYGSRKINANDCKEDTLYVVLKNPRLISMHNEMFQKYFYFKNNSPLKTVGYRNVPYLKGTEKVKITDGKTLTFDKKLKEPKLIVKDTVQYNQSTQGPVQDLDQAVMMKMEKYEFLEFI